MQGGAVNGRRDGVVTGYDGSVPAGVAVEWAAGEARRRGVRLTVLHMADPALVIAGGSAGDPDPLDAAAARVSEEGAERARKAADGLEVGAQTHLARTVPALVEASREAALLVVGGRGHGELTGALLGSVAFAVAAHAHCPVVVVRTGASPGPGPGRPVVVGVDMWPSARGSVRFAADVASRASAPLVVVSAYRAAHGEGGAPAIYWPLQARGAVESERAARRLALEASEAAAAAAREGHAGLDVRPRVVEGRPARALVEAAEGAGLLVAGARGAGGFAGLRLGSIAHALLHDAPCPVAVTRESGDES
jgi:nucleotide-binding universal stress UspA family protein